MHTWVVAVQPFLHGLDELQEPAGDRILAAFSRRVQAQAAYLETRMERLDKTLTSLGQTYFSLAQDEANHLAERQSEITKRLSAWAFLLAVPTIVFSLYGTNFQNVSLLQEDWGYPVMVVTTVLLCLICYWRLRHSGWL